VEQDLDQNNGLGKIPNEVASSACVVCDLSIFPNQESVPVFTQTGWERVHTACYDKWVSWNR